MTTVKELIEQLKEIPQNKVVQITSMDDDFCCEDFEVHSYIPECDEEDAPIEIIMGVYIDSYTEEPSDEDDEELFFDSIEELVQTLSKEELMDFMYAYNNYVATYYEDHDFPCEPVCMLEYFNNDYQEDED